MILLDNWSEYGEGHSILPSALYGFGYLAAIRRAVTGDCGYHRDVRPEGPFNSWCIQPTLYGDGISGREVVAEFRLTGRFYEKKTAMDCFVCNFDFIVLGRNQTDEETA